MAILSVASRLVFLLKPVDVQRAPRLKVNMVLERLASVVRTSCLRRRIVFPMEQRIALRFGKQVQEPVFTWALGSLPIGTCTV